MVERGAKLDGFVCVFLLKHDFRFKLGDWYCWLANQVTSVLLVGSAALGSAPCWEAQCLWKMTKRGLCENSAPTPNSSSLYTGLSWSIRWQFTNHFEHFLSHIHFESLKKKVLWYTFEQFRCSITCCLFYIFLMEKNATMSYHHWLTSEMFFFFLQANK